MNIRDAAANLVGICGWNTPDIYTRLAAASNPSGVVLFNQYEWEYTSIGSNPSFEQIVDYVNEREIPFYIITGESYNPTVLYDISDNRYRNIQPIVHWETFWLTRTYEYFTYTIYNLNINNMQVNNSPVIDKLFISLNNKIHYHRCMLLDYISKYDLFSFGAVSFCDWLDNDDHNNSWSNNYQFKHWSPKCLTLDSSLPGSVNWTNEIPADYNGAFMQIVSESQHNRCFITEKTAKPLYFNKLFLVQGCMHFYKILDSYGFVRYDNVFDYSFDNEYDLETRTQLLLNNLVQLRSLDFIQLSQLHQESLPRLQHNKQLLHSLALDSNKFPNIIKELCVNNSPALDGDTSVINMYHKYAHVRF